LDDISALSSLTEITGDALIQSHNLLTDLDGLENLGSIGGDLTINMNSGLLNVNALMNLNSIGDRLTIRVNPGLQNLDGLENLNDVGGLFISDNNGLQNIDALSSITSLDGILEISDHSSLQNLNGLANLQSVIGNIFIARNQLLQNLDDLEQLQTVSGNVTIISNPALENINQLTNFQSIQGDLGIGGNDILEEINGLANLKSISGMLAITGNPKLRNIDGLASLTSVGSFFSVANNPVLSECCGIRPILLLDNIDPNTIGGIISIFSNDAGCTSVNEIIMSPACMPTIELSGSGNAISCGSTTPLSTNLTDFGSTTLTAPPITNTFTIDNNGSNLLILSGATSTNPLFTISTLPPFVPTGTSATFTVTFSPVSIGTEASLISIGNNSFANSPTCAFTVQGAVPPPPQAAPTIPTLSEWALFLFGLSILAWFSNLIVVMQGDVPNGTTARLSLTRIVWIPTIYRSVLPKAVALGLLGLLLIPLIWGELLIQDVFGLALSVALVAFIMHLGKVKT